MKFELIKKVPIVKIDGKKCFVDTGWPYKVDPVKEGVLKFFGISGLHVAGVQSLKRYTKFDYPNCEISTSDDPISLEGGETMPVEILCGDARDNKARLDCCAVPPEGVVGFDFFNNFTVVVDRLGGKMTFVKN